MAAVGSVPYCH